MVPGDGTEMLQRCGGYTYEQWELRGAEGEERRGKEKDGCPLTLAMYLFVFLCLMGNQCISDDLKEAVLHMKAHKYRNEEILEISRFSRLLSSVLRGRNISWAA
jgi:hypothetical protein